MIVIYTQENTYIKKDAESSRDILITIYGKKFGEEAYSVIKDAVEGASYRKNGGPLVQVISKDTAEKIYKKENELGMLTV